MPIMIDSNVILDITNEDPVWMEWSMNQLETHASAGFIFNPMIYAELCCNFDSTAEVDRLFTDLPATFTEIPRQALFLVSKAHLLYRARGGSRVSGLPDFFIGAHASVLGIPILTRDTARFRTYFPEVELISP